MTAVLQTWDAQQAAYIAGREERFAAMLDVLALVGGDTPRVVDLACGPGSLTARVLDRLPGAHVVGIDWDPALLDIAGEAVTGATFVEGDLTAATWPDAVREALGAAPDAVVSSTALHWLLPHELVRVYGQCWALLAPGGVLLNGDHLRFDDRSPTLRAVAEAHDAATQAAAFDAGAPTWDTWWDDLRADPRRTALVAERDRRFADRGPTPPTTVAFHLEALIQAGFAETGTVWQLHDDHVVFGRR